MPSAASEEELVALTDQAVSAEGAGMVSSENGQKEPSMPSAAWEEELVALTDQAVSAEGAGMVSSENGQRESISVPPAVWGEEPVAIPSDPTVSAQEPVGVFAKDMQTEDAHDQPAGLDEEQSVAEHSADANEEQTERGKIIQLSARAARTTQQPGSEKRTGPAKGNGRKGKGSLNRTRKGNG